MDIYGSVILYTAFGLLIGRSTACNNPPPVVEHSSSNSTGSDFYTNGTIIKYRCNYGYQGVGDNTVQCINNLWVGQYNCFETCDSFYGIENGRIVDEPSFIVGSRVTFACNVGYAMVGEASLVCRANRKWRPSQPPRCEAVNCGDFSYIINGHTHQVNLDGIINVYGKVVDVTCDEGYVLNGSPTVTCQADGAWGQKPTCDVSDCGPHPALSSSCIYDTQLAGGVLTLLCKGNSDNVSVTEVGIGIAMCSNNVWDQLDMACYCDCKINADFNTVELRNVDGNYILKHGRTLDWDCKTGSKVSEESITCYDGQVNNPQCVSVYIDGRTAMESWVVIVIIVASLILVICIVGVVYMKMIRKA